MRRVWMTTWIVVGGMLGFVVGAVPAFVISFNLDGSAECDGPCFSTWVPFVTLGAGGLCAILAAFIAWRLVRRRSFAERPSASS